MTPRTNALADRHGDIDPDSPYWEALSLATEMERELLSHGPNPLVMALDSQAFYELCQTYRHINQRISVGEEKTVEAFEALKRYILDNSSPCGPNVPEGWKLVPIKPTDAMIEAQFKCWHDENSGKEAYVAEMYTAMVEACPPCATGER